MSIKKTLNLVLIWGILGLSPILGWGNQGELQKALMLNEQVVKLYQAGRYQEALPLAQQALHIKERVLGPAHPDTIISLNNLAALYKGMGAYSKALPLHVRAFQISKNVHGLENPETLTYLQNLAEIYRLKGAYYEALSRNKKALDIAKRVFGPEHPRTATIHNNLALTYFYMGVYDKALSNYNLALKIKEDVIPEDPRTADSYDNLALLHGAVGAYNEALRWRQKALKIYEKALGPKHPDTILCRANLASLYEKMGVDDQSLSLFQQVLEIGEMALGPDHPITENIRLGLGSYYLTRKNFSQAEYYLNKCKLIAAKAGLVDLALEQAHPETALRQLAQLAPSLLDTPIYHRQFHTQKGLALAALGRDRLAEAAIHLWQAVQGTEISREKVKGERAGFLSAGQYGGNIRPYRGLVRVLAQMAATEVALPQELREFGPEPQAAAYYFAEATKARALLEAMAQAAQKTSRSGISKDNLRQREKNLRNQIGTTEGQWEIALQFGEEAVQWAKEEREKLTAELQNLIQELRRSNRNSDRLYAALHYPQPCDARDLPLHDNEVLLEYALGKEASYVFLVRKGGVQKLYPIKIPQEDLKKKIQEFMKPLLKPREASFSVKLGQELYDLLLADALAEVNNEKERVIIVPDGILGLLPFEALVMPEGEKPEFVGDRYTLTYYQSASVLAFQRTRPEQKTSRPLFALGNPIYHKDDPRYLAWKQGKPAPKPPLDEESKEKYAKEYAYKALASHERRGKTTVEDTSNGPLIYPLLWGSQDEVKEVAQIWGVKLLPPHVLLGVSASETSLRQTPLQNYRYLLFATHAEVGGKVQGKKEPFILLGQVMNDDEKDDGFLTQSEVLDMELNAQMVVLSACHTGQGEVMEGEGVINFARAFQHAGARSVLVSLWEVKEKIAVKFMSKFFSYLNEGKGRGEALRLARQAVKKRCENYPYLWAVFILHGEG